MRFSLISALVPMASSSDYDGLWTEFQSAYGRLKAVEGYNVAMRFDAFKANVDFIAAENAKNNSYKLAINKFADLTFEEFGMTYMGLGHPEELHADVAYLGDHSWDGTELPDEVDWSMRGAVTIVKNQQSCGSCWAYGTTGSLEGAWQIATGQLKPMSEQQFVDCSHDGNLGCRGGLPSYAFRYAQTADICTEDSYAYEGSEGDCRSAECAVAIPQGSVQGFKAVQQRKEDLMSAVSMGPVAVLIQASLPFQLYSHGVLNWICGARFNHAVLAVGYGNLDGKDYWRVKNSWGADWGMDGYILMKRGKRGYGQCGILRQATYPIVSASVVV